MYWSGGHMKEYGISIEKITTKLFFKINHNRYEKARILFD